jgi:hypothetical protein
MKKCALCENMFKARQGNQKYCCYECAYVAQLEGKRKWNQKNNHGRNKTQQERITSDQLCWKCQKACGGCSWSAEFKPVKGWTAQKTKIRVQSGRHIKSYEIIDCPEYVPDD